VPQGRHADEHSKAVKAVCVPMTLKALLPVVSNILYMCPRLVFDNENICHLILVGSSASTRAQLLAENYLLDCVKRKTEKCIFDHVQLRCWNDDPVATSKLLE
jgi:hypothetical protein